MAGDWIKIEKALPDKPEVLALAEALGLDVDAVVGKLVRVWSWADGLTRDGNAPSVTTRMIDALARTETFSENLRLVGWLSVTDDGVRFPRFNRHMSQSAKRRALTNQRVAWHRKRKCNARRVTKALPEKRREEKRINTPPSTSPPSQNLIELNRADRIWSGISDQDRAFWRETYPACDLDHELRAMIDWCLANPAKGRKSNYRRFIANWLKRQQDKGGSSTARRPAGTVDPDAVRRGIEEAERFMGRTR